MRRFQNSAMSADCWGMVILSVAMGCTHLRQCNMGDGCLLMFPGTDRNRTSSRLVMRVSVGGGLEAGLAREVLAAELDVGLDGGGAATLHVTGRIAIEAPEMLH